MSTTDDRGRASVPAPVPPAQGAAVSGATRGHGAGAAGRTYATAKDLLRHAVVDGALVDQYGRTSAMCRESAEAARAHARAMRAAQATLEEGEIVLGRLGGAKQAQRCDVMGRLFEAVAERDADFAWQLARLAREEAV